jgi:hypothetical protein
MLMLECRAALAGISMIISIPVFIPTPAKSTFHPHPFRALRSHLRTISVAVGGARVTCFSGKELSPKQPIPCVQGVILKFTSGMR